MGNKIIPFGKKQPVGYEILSNGKIALPVIAYPLWAGTPSEFPEENEYFDEYLDLNEELVDNVEDSCVVRVKGDSMEPILKDGDRVIVDRSLRYRATNEIVWAYLDGEMLIKHLRIINNTWYLVAENPEYEPIEIKGGMRFEVRGVVVSQYSRIRPKNR